MATRADELHDPVIVEIDDEFSRLSSDEQIRRTAAWLDAIDDDEPFELGASAAELLAEARAEDGWL